jgi:hypothetical protein
MPRVVVEPDASPQMVGHDLDEIEHLERTGELEMHELT